MKLLMGEAIKRLEKKSSRTTEEEQMLSYLIAFRDGDEQAMSANPIYKATLKKISRAQEPPS